MDSEDPMKMVQQSMNDMQKALDEMYQIINKVMPRK